MHWNPLTSRPCSTHLRQLIPLPLRFIQSFVLYRGFSTLIEYLNFSNSCSKQGLPFHYSSSNLGLAVVCSFLLTAAISSPTFQIHRHHFKYLQLEFALGLIFDWEHDSPRHILTSSFNFTPVLKLWVLYYHKIARCSKIVVLEVWECFYGWLQVKFQLNQNDHRPWKLQFHNAYFQKTEEFHLSLFYQRTCCLVGKNYFFLFIFARTLQCVQWCLPELICL